jgi:predicted MFS family arabinose efflux permease
MMAAFYGLAFANIFLRSTMGVLAPELADELALTPEMLGAIASAYFISYALLQIPTGMLLDKLGPRRTVTSLFALTVIGTAMFTFASSGPAMMLARLLMGAGCAGVFAAAFMVISRFFAAERMTSVGGALNSFGMVGTLMATAPLAALVVAFGWRTTFGGITVAMAAVALLALLSIRDYPPGKTMAPAARSESMRVMLSGSYAVMKTPGVLALASAGIALAAGNTLLGIWGGPYLHDVHGLDEVGRGKVLSCMALAGVSGHFIFGYIARWLNTLKWIVVAGGVGIVCITATLAALAQPSLLAVTLLLALLGFACSFPTILLAHARSIVPERLMGRGLTTVNTGIMASIALMQLAVGAVIGWAHSSADTSDPAFAYRAAFAFLSGMALLSTLIYLRVEDRPLR